MAIRVPSMLPSRLELAAAGLREAVQEIATGEERALAFLDAYAALPEEGRGRLPDAIVALDRIDLALRDLQRAIGDLERAAAVDRSRRPLVQLRERPH
jgi:hypothetical protein